MSKKGLFFFLAVVLLIWGLVFFILKIFDATEDIAEKFSKEDAIEQIK